MKTANEQIVICHRRGKEEEGRVKN